MSKRTKNSKSRAKLSMLLALWGAGLLSTGLLWFLGATVSSVLAGFRSCGVNSGIYLANCGKASLSSGDLLLFGLFAMTGCMVVSFYTNAWRMTRNKESA